MARAYEGRDLTRTEPNMAEYKPTLKSKKPARKWMNWLNITKLSQAKTTANEASCRRVRHGIGSHVKARLNVKVQSSSALLNDKK